MTTSKVLVFRHELFKVSEPFITQQAEQLNAYQPIYIGRSRCGNAPAGAASLALTDMPQQRSFARRLWQVLTRDPNPYLALLGQHEPTLIHAHFGVEGIYALRLAQRLGIPLVTTFHGFDATTSTRGLLLSGSPSWINYLRCRGQLAKSGDLFLCVSEYIRQRALQLGFPEERTRVHYIGIDARAIAPRAVEEETPMVLHVARLVEKKGTEYLIRAFAQTVSQIPASELVIVGEGPLRESLQKLAGRLGIGSRVRFLGVQSHSEVLAIMRKAAMLALPSVTASSGDAEGLGMVLLEAAALGLPLLGTIHGGIPEVIVDDETGYLVPERDVDALGNRIAKLLASPDLRHAMGRQARAHIESRFDIRQQTRLLEGYYSQLVTQRS